jgi:alpha-glucosidase
MKKIKNLSGIGLSTFTLSLLMICIPGFGQKTHTLKSPDGTIQVNIKATDQLYYNLLVDGQEKMWFSPLSMSTNKGVLGKNPKLINSHSTYVNEVIKTVWGIRREVKNEYNQLQLTYEGGYSVVFRAFDDGVSYRFVTDLKGDLFILNEQVEYRFLENHKMVNHVVSHFTTSYEQPYTKQSIVDVKTEDLVCLPSIVIQDDLKLAIVESDVYDYPGLYLTKNTRHSWPNLIGTFARYPLKTEVGGDRWFNRVVTERADYISKTNGKREFPWRALIVARNDVDLLDSDMVYKLARPSMIDTDWIKPGLVAWDWFNALNLHGVDFEAGINNETYEYFIDFAARNNIPYVILDEGWSDQFDLLLPTSNIDMERLSSYATQKGVGLILWAVWHVIDRQYEEAFTLMKKWGIAGVKVDFIDRDDQLAIEYYERFAREAAKYQLLVDYHGCSKPTGLHRTYPNVVNYEAVRGNEYNKFSQNVPTPEHNVEIAFIRMLAGPMDYTPGAMRNSVKGDFYTSFENPMSMGTRAHQIGMFIAYFAPIQMLCDAPTQYEMYPDILTFLSDIPTTWDETVALEGKIGEYLIIARKKGDDWYIGGLTNWTERDVTIDLSGFTNGKYKMRIVKDGINANRLAEDYKYEEKSVSSTDKVDITMKMGGGLV